MSSGVTLWWQNTSRPDRWGPGIAGTATSRGGVGPPGKSSSVAAREALVCGCPGDEQLRRPHLRPQREGSSRPVSHRRGRRPAGTNTSGERLPWPSSSGTNRMAEYLSSLWPAARRLVTSNRSQRNPSDARTGQVPAGRHGTSMSRTREVRSQLRPGRLAGLSVPCRFQGRGVWPLKRWQSGEVRRERRVREGSVGS